MNESNAPLELRTQFKRSKLCRAVHVDGAWGSITPQGFLHMAVYNEHRAFPEGTTIRAKQDGGIEDVADENPGYLVREIEADLLLSESTATALRNWLSDRLDEYASLRQRQAEEEKPQQSGRAT